MYRAVPQVSAILGRTGACAFAAALFSRDSYPIDSRRSMKNFIDPYCLLALVLWTANIADGCDIGRTV
jgi:hypothetical protein